MPRIETETVPEWTVWFCSTHGVVPEGDLLEGQDPNRATSADPDGWTDTYYCPVCSDAAREQVWALDIEETAKELTRMWQARAAALGSREKTDD